MSAAVLEREAPDARRDAAQVGESVGAPRFGGICDRCSKPFRTPSFPNDALCRACYLGALTPVERAVALVSGPVS